ncbi:hypothetical protein M422DRAFT_25100, partial [Sphaerobolus stellatus SS14]
MDRGRRNEDEFHRKTAAVQSNKRTRDDRDKWDDLRRHRRTPWMHEIVWHGGIMNMAGILQMEAVALAQYLYPTQEEHTTRGMLVYLV